MQTNAPSLIVCSGSPARLRRATPSLIVCSGSPARLRRATPSLAPSSDPSWAPPPLYPRIRVGLVLCVLGATLFGVALAVAVAGAFDDESTARAEAPRGPIAAAAVIAAVPEEPPRADTNGPEDGSAPDEPAAAPAPAGASQASPASAARSGLRGPRIARTRAAREGRAVGGATVVAAPVSHELTRTDIAPVIHRNRHRMQSCYEVALRRHGSMMPVDVRLTVDIAPTGQVDGVHVAGNAPGGMPECIAGVAQRLRFPESRRGARVPVPLHFEPRAL